MTPDARLLAAIDLLRAVDADARPADAVVSGWFRARRDLRDEDRATILRQVYGVLRHRARLDWWLARQERPASARLRLLGWLVMGEGMARDRVPVALTPDERALLGRLQGGSLDHPQMPLGVRFECPDWALGPLQARFGADFEPEMAATLAPPPLDLRVNPLRATREAVMAELRRRGLTPEPTPLAPLGVRLPERVSLARLPMLKTGEAEIQDEGSQLVARLVDAGPGERVVDFCAGAGGKTLALASDMANKGVVIACDVSESRLKRAAERFRAAGLHNIQTRVLSSERDKWVKRHKGGFDRVLVDAPCSGTGAWRRNPDARWRAETGGLDALAALQGEILASAARLVRPGGRLVYATCSMLTEENEAQVERFLAANLDFSLVPLAEAAPELAAAAEGRYLALTPARHGTDGFFAAVMMRAGAA